MPEQTKIPLLLPSSTSDKGCLAGSPLPRPPHPPPPPLPFLPDNPRLVRLHLRTPSSPPRPTPTDDPVVTLHAICATNADVGGLRLSCQPAVLATPVLPGGGGAPARRSRWWAWPWRRRGAVVIGGAGDGGGGRDGCGGSRRAGLGWGRMGGGTGRGAMGGVPAGACGLWFSMEESSREGRWWPPARADGDGGRKKMRGG
ncbi:hypothetical protein OsJ_06740 [Oryza sativa Japonica Group]|uniref:Uncharacterized protein n=1 Tax=Oryza sativa subsp. japonica TaxID=39947 RepID=Q6K6W2_ORYSJ|nr:hypothetical protein OsJ_06740 [Oryza sativa Japonica Group]BAD21934.1 hypothetical protein [Oryza sativa Japonica Group]